MNEWMNRPLKAILTANKSKWLIEQTNKQMEEQMWTNGQNDPWAFPKHYYEQRQLANIRTNTMNERINVQIT